jgi:serine/threonine protein kinase/tetratricopeptide (TPR) repeat protein
MYEALAAGTNVAHYRIVSRLGAGGMGDVYLAQDTKLDRAVALKILPAEVADDQGRMRRFVQEAKAASALSHPNVAHIYEIGEADGVHFIAMEYVEGRPLRDKIGGQSLEAGEILDLGTQIADALDEAYSKGVTHRDIKPANIMVTPRGQVKVLDFGLAKVTRPHAPNATGETETQAATDPGVVLGTVHYMSPEQALGRDVDHRSDIFSLGVVLYEMATGRLPFSGSTPAETLSRILQAQPEAMARLNYSVSPELERIVRKCLEKERERRYQSARELVVDLRNLKRDSDSGSAAISVGQSRSLLWVALSILATALAVVVAYVWLGRGEPIESLAVLPFVNVGGDPGTEYLTDGITENLINSFSQLPRLRVVPRSLAFSYKAREVDPRKVGRDLNVRAVLMGRVVQRGDGLNVQAELVDVTEVSQLWGRQYSRKFSDILTIQEEIAREVSAKLRLRPTVEQNKRLAKRSTENTEAYQAYLKGRYYWNRRTEQTLKRAVEYFQQAIDKDPDYALAYAGLADCYAVYTSYQVEAPRESGTKARTAAIQAVKIDETLAEPHASLGMTLMQYDWDWAGAEREFQRSIELDPKYPTAHIWYGIYLGSTGRAEQAVASHRRAQQLDPLSLIINTGAGWELYFARRHQEAIEQIRKTLEMDPTFARGHWFLGLAYEQEAMYREAIAEFQKAFDLSEGSPSMLGTLGHAYALSGNREKARQALAHLQELSKRRYVPPFDPAVIYAGLGDKERAFEWLEKAFEDRSWGMVRLKVDPRFDRLHADPRFASLLRRMGLEP